MAEIYELEFKGRRKEYAANPLQFPFELGDIAIVDVERGQDLGRISHAGWRPGMDCAHVPPLLLVRRASTADIKIIEQNRDRESKARAVARKKIVEHNLEMKLVDVELQWDSRKMTFYFTAEGRVDFRELVKDLASSFRTRIDLRQIGARDETKRTGGYGVCGRSLCCATFLTEFKPITTQMPRDQFLPLNPTKLSGVCGRLKCCLRYELDVYREFQRSCPKLGHPVRDAVKGDGAVEKLDLVRDHIQIKYGSGDLEKYTPVEFRELTNWQPEMPKSECICTCGRKAPPVAVVEEPVPDYSAAAARGGERVTFLPGGGLGLQSPTGGADIQVGTETSVPPAASKPKKKRKRRRSGKKTDGGSAGTTDPGQQPGPASADS